jgi:enterobactin synthetase component D
MAEVVHHGDRSSHVRCFKTFAPCKTVTAVLCSRRQQVHGAAPEAMTNTPERVQMDGVNHQGFDPLQDLLAMRENPRILRAAAAHRSCVVREELIVCASLAAALRSQLPCELKTVADRRKIDFVAGRRCALLACRDVGLHALDDIPVRADRTPAWPIGLVGSITHTSGFASAAVAYRNIVRGLGIDTENVMTENTVEEICDLTMNSSERRLGRELSKEIDERTFCTLIFSAKESIYKCLNPLVGDFFDFLDCEIFVIDLTKNTFRFRCLNSLNAEFVSGWTYEGRFERSGRYVHTGVELLNSAHQSRPGLVSFGVQ